MSDTVSTPRPGSILGTRVLRTEDLTPKVLAAHRAGIRRVLIPERNRHDLEEMPRELLQEVKITLISSMDQVLPLVLADPAAQNLDRGAGHGEPSQPVASEPPAG